MQMLNDYVGSRTLSFIMIGTNLCTVNKHRPLLLSNHIDPIGKKSSRHKATNQIEQLATTAITATTSRIQTMKSLKLTDYCRLHILCSYRANSRL
ncbi:hypothetical protein BpHYR1_029902 [Brachionus plicatilis]|uniref:Uncharacterized protein n=1 Tax=Brachionus plicatilis TaxID=10195 RepID=A0A3M7PKE7_BRAPC|nr:hypothetical protein BpHYR1_029902 [Brachionus plicatilis]